MDDAVTVDSANLAAAAASDAGLVVSAAHGADRLTPQTRSADA